MLRQGRSRRHKLLKISLFLSERREGKFLVIAYIIIPFRVGNFFQQAFVGDISI
jgi:hypothetical protein